jgi:hypothetical protein
VFVSLIKRIILGLDISDNHKYSCVSNSCDSISWLPFVVCWMGLWKDSEKLYFSPIFPSLSLKKQKVDWAVISALSLTGYFWSKLH